jgi:trigger factor
MSEKNNVTIEKLPHSQLKITIVVAKKAFDSFMDKAAKDLAGKVKVDGFRKGKVPKALLEQQIGAEQLLYEGADKAVRKTYVDAILDNKIEAIGEPKIVIKKIAKGDDFEYEATVAVMPELTLGEWEADVKKINEKYAGKSIKVKEEEIKRELDYLAKQRAKIITVNRAAQKDDQVKVDFEVLRNNVLIENGSAKDHELVIGEARFIPGFEEQLIGLEAGQEKDFELEFPKEYHQKDLAGQKAVFHVKMKLVQERQVPEINDDFAASIGKFKNLVELKKNIEEGIEHEAKHKQEDEQKREIIDTIVNIASIDLPEVLLEMEVQRIMEELEHEVSHMGLDKQAYLQHLNTTEDALKKQWKEKEAPARVKAALILKQLAKLKKLEPSSSDIEMRMNKQLQYFKTIQDADEKLDMERFYEAIKGSMRNEMVLEYLMKL